MSLSDEDILDSLTLNINLSLAVSLTRFTVVFPLVDRVWESWIMLAPVSPVTVNESAPDFCSILTCEMLVFIGFCDSGETEMR